MLLPLHHLLALFGLLAWLLLLALLLAFRCLPLAVLALLLGLLLDPFLV